MQKRGSHRLQQAGTPQLLRLHSCSSLTLPTLPPNLSRFYNLPSGPAVWPISYWFWVLGRVHSTWVSLKHPNLGVLGPAGEAGPSEKEEEKGLDSVPIGSHHSAASLWSGTFSCLSHNLESTFSVCRIGFKTLSPGHISGVISSENQCGPLPLSSHPGNPQR